MEWSISECWVPSRDAMGVILQSLVWLSYGSDPCSTTRPRSYYFACPPPFAFKPLNPHCQHPKYSFNPPFQGPCKQHHIWMSYTSEVDTQVASGQSLRGQSKRVVQGGHQWLHHRLIFQKSVLAHTLYAHIPTVVSMNFFFFIIFLFLFFRCRSGEIKTLHWKQMKLVLQNKNQILLL